MSEEKITSPMQTADDQLRSVLEDILKHGLKTEIEPRAYSHEQIYEIVFRLQTLTKEDYKNKLVFAGFTITPYNPGDNVDEDQACETCMYYLVHRRFCELPELMLPVNEGWSCRLWRI
ncbi:MAG: hypothetical protein L3J75_02780 [Methylococcaceae bacterium]|nr:hypothetical protein [Methylococcaceae bacterium]